MWRAYGRWILMITASLTVMAAPALADKLAAPTDLMERVAVKALRQGDRGQAVAALQQLLADAGFNPGKVDGIFGPLTEGAVRRAQAASGLATDGLAGSLTLMAVEKQLATTPAKAPAQTVTFTPGDLVVHVAANLAGAAPDADGAPAAPQQQFFLTLNGLPSAELTPRVLELLDQHQMKATFFVYGEAAAAQPDLIRQIAERGHEIASNGWSDTDMTSMTEPTMRAQIERSALAIEAATGRRPAFFRPPQGRFTDAVGRAAHESGLTMQLWSNVLVRDLPDADPDALATKLLGTVHPNAVLMLHHDRPNSVNALEQLLRKVRENGYRSITLSAGDQS